MAQKRERWVSSWRSSHYVVSPDGDVLSPYTYSLQECNRVDRDRRAGAGPSAENETSTASIRPLHFFVKTSLDYSSSTLDLPLQPDRRVSMRAQRRQRRARALLRLG